MANHQNFYCWLKNIVKITQTKDKSWFSLIDDIDNDITFYGDKDEKLFKAFCEALPKAKVKKIT